MVYHVQFPGLGLDLTVNRVALAIGGFNIYWYGVIIAAGMLLAMLYAFRNAVDYGIDSDRLVDVVAIGTVMAIVCARIYYVAMAPFAYQSLWEMIDIRKGGIAIYGAVIGAFVFDLVKIRPIRNYYRSVAEGMSEKKIVELLETAAAEKDGKGSSSAKGAAKGSGSSGTTVEPVKKKPKKNQRSRH